MKISENKLRQIIREEINKISEAGMEVYQVRVGIDRRKNGWKRDLEKLEKLAQNSPNAGYDTETFPKVKNLDVTFDNRRDAESFEQEAERLGHYTEFETLNV